MRYYMITIDKVSTVIPAEKKHYIGLIKKFQKDHKIIDEKISCFEKNKLNRIHYHGLISSPNFLKYTDFNQIGFSIHLQYLKSIQDRLTAIKYIIKHKKDQIDIDKLVENQLSKREFKLLANAFADREI